LGNIWQVVVEEKATHTTKRILNKIQAKMMESFDIEHLNIQFEYLFCRMQRVECVLNERRR